MGRLYVVATPIGNLEDITLRAANVLRSVPFVACEDTRHSGRLLAHLGARPTLLSCRSHNTAQCVARVLGILESGADIAYISDAGTPGVSDPGAALVAQVRAAGHTIEPIPGVSAVTTLVSVSGVAGRGWLFEGFLSTKSGKRLRRLEELLARGEAFVLYESPHRIGKLAAELVSIEPHCRVVVGRELTKLHEQIVDVSAAELVAALEDGRVPVKGEFAVLVVSEKNG